MVCQSSLSWIWPPKSLLVCLFKEMCPEGFKHCSTRIDYYHLIQSVFHCFKYQAVTLPWKLLDSLIWLLTPKNVHGPGVAGFHNNLQVVQKSPEHFSVSHPNTVLLHVNYTLKRIWILLMFSFVYACLVLVNQVNQCLMQPFLCVHW